MKLKNIFLHFNKVLTHKYWVSKYCFKCGLYWQGITHDLSKFSFVEFWESAKYYQGTFSPIDACKAENGYSLAWLHHKGRNKHHFEYWTDHRKSDNSFYPIKMPYKYAVEMLCDYIGAAKAYMGDKFTYENEVKWWETRQTQIFIHEETKQYITECFKQLEIFEKYHSEDRFFKEKWFKKLYQ